MAVDIVEMDDLKHILKETITAICRSRLHQAAKLSIEALIGITINKSQMLLVNINEDLMSDMPVTGLHQPRPALNLPPRKFPKAFKGRTSTAQAFKGRTSTVHSFSSLRGGNKGRGRGLKSILPRLPIATQSSRLDSLPQSPSVQNIKDESESPPEKKPRSILLTAGDTYSPDTGELLPNPSNLIPLEPQFDTSPTDQPSNAEDSEDNNKSQIGDMLPGIEGSHAEGPSTSQPGVKPLNESLMPSTSRQSSQEDGDDSIGTLNMVCDTDDPSADTFRIKQEMPSYDDSFDQEAHSPSAPVSGQAVFPTAKILDILNQPPRKIPRECKKRKILTLETRIQVLEMLQSGRSARSIAAQLGVGRTQIQNILKEKELILSKWVQGASSDMKYINPRRRPYADVDNLVWQWFQEYSSCGVHITGKLIQQTALQLAKELGNEKFSASNGWLESWQRRHNVKLSALYEAHKSKAPGVEVDPNVTVGTESTGKLDTSTEAPNSESESFFKSGNEVIMESDSGEETSASQKDQTTGSSDFNTNSVCGVNQNLSSTTHRNGASVYGGVDSTVSKVLGVLYSSMGSTPQPFESATFPNLKVPSRNDDSDNFNATKTEKFNSSSSDVNRNAQDDNTNSCPVRCEVPQQRESGFHIKDETGKIE